MFLRKQNGLLATTLCNLVFCSFMFRCLSLRGLALCGSLLYNLTLFCHGGCEL